jgi:hypothetical protein
MERRINEDLAIGDKFRWGFVIVVVALLLLCFSFGVWDLHSWKPLAEGVTFAVIVLVWARIAIRGALRDRLESGLSWMLTDDGLARVYPSQEREAIRWEQIRYMKWVRGYGLIVRWEESNAEHQRRSRAFKNEFRWDWVYRQYRAVLDVQKDEAKELMSAVQEKIGLRDGTD